MASSPRSATTPRVRSSRTGWLLLALVVAGGLTLRLVDLNRQGETWDEIAYYDAGKLFFNNLQHRDFNPDHWDGNFEHPPVGKYLYLIANLKVYQTDHTNYLPGRVASAVMGMLTVLLVYLIGRRLATERAGLLAATTLAFLPLFVAYNLVLGLDTPTTLFWTATVWVFLEAVFRRSHWWYLAAAVLAGLAIGTRLSNLLLLPALLLIWAVWRWPERVKSKELRVKGNPTTPHSSLLTPHSPRTWAELLHILTFIVVPVAVFFATWPWLWGSSWREHLGATLGHWGAIDVIFLGTVQVAPPSYYLLYLLVTIPALILVALSWFLWWTLVTRRAAWLAVLVWVVAPFLFSFFGTRQGGLRYLLVIAPAIALATGLVLDELMGRIPNRWNRTVLGGTLVAYLILSSLAVRPYYLDYYNEFSGGPGVVAAHRWFQIGWWNEGVDEAIAWVNATAPVEAAVTLVTEPHRSDDRLRDDLRLADHVEADYVVVNPGYLWYRPTPDGLLTDFTPVYQVRVLGASLATVYQRTNEATRLTPGMHEPIQY